MDECGHLEYTALCVCVTYRRSPGVHTICPKCWTGAKPPKEVIASPVIMGAMFLQAGEGFLGSDEGVCKAAGLP